MTRMLSVHHWVWEVVERKAVECFFVLVLVIVEEQCLFLLSFRACCEGWRFFPADYKVRVEREMNFARH